jgi:hypothetical protein
LNKREKKDKEKTRKMFESELNGREFCEKKDRLVMLTEFYEDNVPLWLSDR